MQDECRSSLNGPRLYLIQVSLSSLLRLLPLSPFLYLFLPYSLARSFTNGLVLQPDSLRSTFNCAKARKGMQMREKGLCLSGDISNRQCPCQPLFTTSQAGAAKHTFHFTTWQPSKVAAFSREPDDSDHLRAERTSVAIVRLGKKKKKESKRDARCFYLLQKSGRSASEPTCALHLHKYAVMQVERLCDSVLHFMSDMLLRHDVY